MLNRNKLLALIVFMVVLAVFSPSFFADVYSIDDMRLIDRLHKMVDFDFVNFIRGGKGLYYRPFISASYKLDAFLFNANVMGMHAENIILHGVNVLLLIAVLRHVFNCTFGNHFPFFCGMLWGIHPLTTESVIWISGRSDVLASTFILSSTFFLFRYRQSRNIVDLICTLLLFIGGVLTKEVMLPFVFLVFLLLRVDGDKKMVKWSFLEGKGLMVWLLPLSALGIIFLRLIAYTSTDGKIVSTLRFMFNDIYYSLFVCLRAFGFYCKKIVLPFPSNFAIMEVDPLYELLAIPLVVLCIFLLFKRDSVSALFLGGVALMSPAFLIAFGQIAWTPYAERYIYLSSAFMLPGVLGYFHKHLEFPSSHFKICIVTLMVVGVAAGTLHRNFVWNTNESLFADTSAKSPMNRVVQITYADILIEAGHYEQALVAINKARAVSSIAYYPKPDILEAKILEEQGHVDEALSLLRGGASGSKYRSSENLKSLLSLLEKRSITTSGAHQVAIYIEIRDVNLKLFKLNYRFRHILNMGKVSTMLGEEKHAISLFTQVLRNAKADSALAREAESELLKLKS